jgi:UDP-glucose 4-epimerase
MVLITGASGFIGRHLLKTLIQQKGAANILFLTSKPIDDCPYILHDNYEIDSALFENRGLDDVTEVIHAGAFTPKKGSQANDVENCYANIRSTHLLLQALPKSVERFILLSTLDVYGITDQSITEHSVISPSSLYGHSKYYCEKALECWAKANDKIIQILRIGHVYGPGEEIYQKIIPETMRKLLRKEAPQIWGKGEELRSFIYVEDVVKMIMNTLKIDTYSGPINIVSENAIKINQLVEMLIRISGLNILPAYLPSVAIPKNLVFDNFRMREILGAEQTTLQEGLTNEWNYMSNTFK